MSYGRAFHAALLEPDRFRREYVTVPSGDMRSQGGKLDWLSACYDLTGVDLSHVPLSDAKTLRAAVSAELRAHGAEVIAEDDLATLHAQVASLNRPEHADARKLITLAQTEVTIRWEVGKLRPKARLDLAIPDHRIVLDLKSCDDADPDEFRRSVYGYGYDYQAAQYLMAAASKWGGEPSEWSFAFLLAGKRRPNHWAWVRLDEHATTLAESRIRASWERLEECIATDTWPGRWTQEPTELVINRRGNQ